MALPRIDINTGCVQTVMGLGGTGLNAMAYSDDVALWQWQWGFIGINASTGVKYLKNGVGKNGLGFCTPAVAIVGDCWQSVVDLIATPNEKKWIIASGGPYMCGGEGLQVWKWNGTTYAWWGLIKSPAHPLKENGAELRLVGDEAWGKTIMGGVGFNRYDLTNKTVLSSLNPTAPPFTPQPSISSSTYRLFPVHPVPIPTPYPGPKVFYALRQGGTPVGNPYAPWIEQLYNEGITGGCGDPAAHTFCPTAPVTREQMAVFLLKVKHGSDYVPPPCTGIFTDVPCGP